MEPAKATQIVSDDDLAQTSAATVKSCQCFELSIYRIDAAGVGAGDTNSFSAGIAQKACRRASVGEADRRMCSPLATVEDRRIGLVDVACCAHDVQHRAPRLWAAAFRFAPRPSYGD
jgi:hypothetical protein